MVSVLFQILLFFLPLVVLPFGSSQFEIPKVILAMIIIDILGVYAFIKRKHFSFHKSLLLLSGLLVLLTIYDLIFLSTPITLWGNQFRMQGVILLWQLVLLGLLSSQFVYKRVAYYWYGLVLVLTFIGSLIFGNNANRSVGTLGEPNALAAFVVFLWPFIFFASDIPSKYSKVIKVIILLLVVVVIVLSGSRSGLLGLLIQLGFYGALKIRTNLKLAVMLGLFLLVAVHFLPFIVHTKYEDRSVIWQTALSAGLVHPVAGGGFGNTELLLRQVIIKEHNTLIGYYIDSSHNILLDWWVQGGIFGVGILIGLLAFVIKNFYERREILYLILLLGLLTSLSFNPASVVELVFLWWLIGQGFTKRTV